MPNIVVKDNEMIEQSLRRFKKEVEKAGILTEIRRREFYEKPSALRKRKAEVARRKMLKKKRERERRERNM